MTLIAQIATNFSGSYLPQISFVECFRLKFFKLKNLTKETILDQTKHWNFDPQLALKSSGQTT
jgi:hypothetical protein